MDAKSASSSHLPPHKLLLRFRQPGASLSPDEVELVHRLAAAGRIFLLSDGRDFVRERADGVLLTSFSADGTPITTSERYVRGETHHRTVRKGGALQEFLVQRLFLRSADGETRLIFREPLPLTAGKSSWHIFSAQRELFGTARQEG